MALWKDTTSQPGTTPAQSFTNPAADENGRKFNLPLAYDAAADAVSWEETKRFLADVFEPE